MHFISQIVGPHVRNEWGNILLGETATSASRALSLTILIIQRFAIFFIVVLSYLNTLHFINDIIRLSWWHGWVRHLIYHFLEDNVRVFCSKMPLNKL